jgi:hypothetical protein
MTSTSPPFDRNVFVGLGDVLDPQEMIDAIEFIPTIVVTATNPCATSLRKFILLVRQRQEYLTVMKIPADQKNYFAKTFNFAREKLTAEVRRTLKELEKSKTSDTTTLLKQVFGHLKNIRRIKKSDLKAELPKEPKEPKKSEEPDVECPITLQDFKKGEPRFRLSLTRKGEHIFIANTADDAVDCMKAILTNPHVATIKLTHAIGNAFPCGSWNGGRGHVYVLTITMANGIVWTTESDKFYKLCYFRGRKHTPTLFGRQVRPIIISAIHRLLLKRNTEQPSPHHKFMFCCIPDCMFATRGFILRQFAARCPRNHSMCLKCGGASHIGTCDQVVGMDAATRSLLVADSKPCPSCNQFITRSDGCNHMTCTCGQHFCWRCLHTFSPQVQYQDHEGCRGLNVYGNPNHVLF